MSEEVIMAEYGYLHLGRVTSWDAASGGYNLESVSLSKASRWGPVPSCVPGLKRGDRVILGAKGTSRDDLVILGRVGAAFPGVNDIDGLIEALASKARAEDVDLLGDQVAGLSGDIGSVAEDLADALAAQDIRDDAQDTEIAATSVLATNVRNALPYSYGNDFHVNLDLVSTIPRWAAVGTMATPNNRAVYARMYTRRNLRLTVLRLVYSATDAPLAGSTAIKIYAGTNLAALPAVYTGTDGLGPHRVDVFPAAPIDIPAGSHIAVGILPTGMGGAETLKIGCSAVPVSSTLTNQDSSTLTTVGKNAQSSLATTLKLDNSADWDIIYSSRPWIALAGGPY